jgi:RNA polymerase sigma-54 factor
MKKFVVFTLEKAFCASLVRMKNTLHIDSRITTQLSLNQNMRQAISLLQMTNFELGDYLEQQAQENPFLEVDSPSIGGATSFSAKPLDDQVARDVAVKPSEIDMIQAQISLAFESQEKVALAEFMLAHLDDRGILPFTLNELSQMTGALVSHVEEVLAILKTFDPIGVFAQSTQECFMLQLQEKGCPHNQALLILDYLNHFLDPNQKSPVFAANSSIESFEQLKQYLRYVNPRPLDSVSDADSMLTLPPDILVTIDHDRVRVELNDETHPTLRVNQGLYNQACKSEDAHSKQYISCAFKEAMWLQKAVSERRKNVLKVAKAILEHQESFLEMGHKGLKPMQLQDIAARTQLHESTVSRIVAHKTMCTPLGVIALKALFSQGLQAVKDHSAVSALVVKHKIKGLIDGEQAKEPLSDEDLVVQLKREGICLARRTVAKYRESLNIAPSHRRRRYKSMGLMSAV